MAHVIMLSQGWFVLSVDPGTSNIFPNGLRKGPYILTFFKGC